MKLTNNVNSDEEELNELQKIHNLQNSSGILYKKYFPHLKIKHTRLAIYGTKDETIKNFY